MFNRAKNGCRGRNFIVLGDILDCFIYLGFCAVLVSLLFSGFRLVSLSSLRK